MRDRRWWTRTLTAATGVAAVTTVAAGVALGASGSARDLVPTGSEAAAAASALGTEEGDREVDPRLAAAREEARALEGRERREAMKEVRDEVAAGEYGEQAQQRQEKRAERVEKLRRGLPAELRDDLAALKEAPEDERDARREAIRDQALAGDYGPGLRRLVRTVG